MNMIEVENIMNRNIKRSSRLSTERRRNLGAMNRSKLANLTSCTNMFGFECVSYKPVNTDAAPACKKGASSNWCVKARMLEWADFRVPLLSMSLSWSTQSCLSAESLLKKLVGPPLLFFFPVLRLKSIFKFGTGPSTVKEIVCRIPLVPRRLR